MTRAFAWVAVVVAITCAVLDFGVAVFVASKPVGRVTGVVGGLLCLGMASGWAWFIRRGPAS